MLLVLKTLQDNQISVSYVHWVCLISRGQSQHLLPKHEHVAATFGCRWKEEGQWRSSVTSKRQRVFCKTEVEAKTAMATGTKRKSGTDRKSPKSKKVCSNTDTSNPPEVPAESKSTKRETKAEEETPTKKQRVNTDAGEPKEVSEVTKHVKEASAEKLPTAETPRTTRRESGCNLSTKPCSPSAPPTGGQELTVHCPNQQR